MRGAPILSAYREKGYIDTFPLHDDETLDRLHKKWKHGNIFHPPIEVTVFQEKGFKLKANLIATYWNNRPLAMHNRVMSCIDACNLCLV